jgi:hypothetical protein
MNDPTFNAELWSQLFWGIFSFVAAIILLPSILSLLGLSRLSARASTNSPRLENPAWPIDMTIYVQLRDLGFEAVGLLRLRYWFWSGCWVSTVHCRVFYLGNDNCCALVANGTVLLLSYFDSGPAVMTSNTLALEQVGSLSEEEVVQRVRAKIDAESNMQDLLVKHEAAVTQAATGRQLGRNAVSALLEDRARAAGFIREPWANKLACLIAALFLLGSGLGMTYLLGFCIEPFGRGIGRLLVSQIAIAGVLMFYFRLMGSTVCDSFGAAGVFFCQSHQNLPSSSRTGQG